MLALSRLTLCSLVLVVSINAYAESEKESKSNPSVAVSGAQLWADNCGACHNLRNPAGYSDAQWAVAVQHMRIRANLTAEEARAILTFLQAAN